MNMHWIDWAIVATLLAFMFAIVPSTRKYTRGVADFLAANRCAGRYLICVCEGIAGLGAISLIGFWERYSQAGFTAIWWSLPDWPIIFILALSGWVIYRFRQSRAMTLAQFLEMRYSRRFRIFAGMVCFLSGIINFGIFPAVGARFFIYFCALPETVAVGPLAIPTFALVMFFLLAVSVFFTFVGGQIAVILTDFVQGVFCMVVMVVTAIVLLNTVSWAQVTEALGTAPEDASLMHPFHTDAAEDFNVPFFLIAWFAWFYNWKAWQGTQGFNCSATSAHEARMANILGQWRFFAQQMLVPILAICAITFIRHPDFVNGASSINGVLEGIDNEQIAKQMTVPLALSRMLPLGLMGGLCAVMFAAFISTHDTYLHSWGSIFIQDVVMPLRNRPLSTRQHLMLLRASICGVALFIFLFSLLFEQNDYIQMYFAVTGAIYLGGAGAVVIGGFYWRRGTTTAAWAAMITGSVLASGSIIIKQLDPAVFGSPALRSFIEWVSSINGQYLMFISSISAITVYVVLSLITGAKPADLDKVLHRGRHATEEQDGGGDGTEGLSSWRKVLGINRQFTRCDRWLYLFTMGWIGLLLVVFIVGTAYNLLSDTPVATWESIWHVVVWASVGLSIIITVWFTLGGLRDLRAMFRRLQTAIHDQADDGTVRPEDNAVEPCGPPIEPLDE